MNIERYARLKSIFPHDYVQIQFDLDSEQYQRAHCRYLEVLEDLEFHENELTTYYAGNIGGVCEAGRGLREDPRNPCPLGQGGCQKQL